MHAFSSSWTKRGFREAGGYSLFGSSHSWALPTTTGTAWHRRSGEEISERKKHRETQFRAKSWPNLQFWQPTGTPKVSLQLKLEFRLDDVGGSSDGTNGRRPFQKAKWWSNEKTALLRAPPKKVDEMMWNAWVVYFCWVNLLHSYICLLKIRFQGKHAGKLGLTRCQKFYGSI